MDAKDLNMQLLKHSQTRDKLQADFEKLALEEKATRARAEAELLEGKEGTASHDLRDVLTRMDVNRSAAAGVEKQISVVRADQVELARLAVASQHLETERLLMLRLVEIQKDVFAVNLKLNDAARLAVSGKPMQAAAVGFYDSLQNACATVSDGLAAAYEVLLVLNQDNPNKVVLPQFIKFP
jgi:hypothetical protein